MSSPCRAPVALAVPGLPRPLALFLHDERDLHVSRCLRETGLWEPYESALVLQLLQPGDVFLDVGANIGYYSLLAAAVVGAEGAVYAFEPDPANFALLEASVQLNGLGAVIQARCAGLAEQSRAARLYLSEDNLGDHQIFCTGDGRDSLPIELLNGTECLRDRAARLDLVKVDTQGAEYGVIVGLMPLLRSLPEQPPIIVELTPLSLRQCGHSGRQLIELLAQLGQPFHIVDHIEHRLVPSSASELARWCDNVDAVPGDAGFMNILVGAAPD